MITNERKSSRLIHKTKTSSKLLQKIPIVFTDDVDKMIVEEIPAYSTRRKVLEQIWEQNEMMP